MPWHGIPVHPVQLYDSFVGFAIFALLLFVRQKWPRAPLFSLFLALYAVGRFFTEFYRGDSFRGENVLLGLTTSQAVSVAILIYLAIRFVRPPRWSPLAAVFFLSGCLPQPPKPSDYVSVQKAAGLSIYQTANSSAHHNVIFVAADDNLQVGLKPLIKKFYRDDSIRLEDLVFWRSFPDLRRNYGVIIQIAHDAIGSRSLSAALTYAETLREPYDLILLTHGLPNYLSKGTGYFFSYRDVDALKGRLPNLNLVFMQSCYGESLAPDWLATGARHVISFSAFNTDFFFYDVFLHELASSHDPSVAYERARAEFAQKMTQSPYKFLIDSILPRNVSRDTYIATLPMPVFD